MPVRTGKIKSAALHMSWGLKFDVRWGRWLKLGEERFIAV
jgi:hypothetical protein